MTWLVYTVLATLGFATMNLLQRVVAIDSQYPRAATAIFSFMGTLVALVIFSLTESLQSFVLPTQPQAWIAFAVAGLFYGLFERNRFRVAKLLPASVWSTMLNFSVLVAFVGSAVLYNETVNLRVILGALLIITALIVVSYKKTQVKEVRSISQQAMMFALLVMTVLGIGWSLDKMGSQYFGPGAYNVLIWGVPLVVIIFPSIKWSKLRHEFAKAWKSMIVLTLVNTTAYYFMLKALEVSAATKVIPLVQTSTLITVFLGIWLLKETERIPQKIAAAVLAVAGVFLLV